MNLATLLEQYGDGAVLATGGAIIGALFGFTAQRSRFCLRSAVIEFARGTHEGKLTVWLFTFSTAVLLTQALIMAGLLFWRHAANIARLSAGTEGKIVPVKDTIAGFKMILEGQLDDVPEGDFYMKGGIDEVLAAAGKK